MNVRTASNFVLTVFLATALFLPAMPRASEISDKLQKLADRLVASYQEKRPAAKGTTLAVFDFTCSEALAKERVGFAVSEMLTSHFVGKPGFTVVERSEMEKVFKEQALQQTGAMDVDTAVNLGKVLGAKTLVLGSVEKVGQLYQVNARMVDAQSAEMLASSYQELPAEAFEAEAKPHLALVPEEQALGFYLIARYGRVGVEPHTVGREGTVYSNTYDLDIDMTGIDSQTSGYGLGVRYFPVSWLMIDASAWLNAFGLSAKPEVKITQSLATGAHQDQPAEYNGITGMGAQLKGYYVGNLSKKVRWFGGAGLDFLIYYPRDKTRFIYNGGFGDMAGHSDTFSIGMAPELNTLLLRPMGTLGIEWRPQPRIGVGLFGSVYPIPTKVKITAKTKRQPGNALLEEQDLFDLNFPIVEGQASLCFYF